MVKSFIVPFVMASCVLASEAMATPTKLKVVDGEKVFYSDEEPLDFGSLNCGNTFAVFTFSQEPSKVVKGEIRLAVMKEGERHRIDINDPFDDVLTADFLLNGLEAGCLSRDGGIGFVFNSSKHDRKEKIQIDNDGRVFKGFDKVGLEFTEN